MCGSCRPWRLPRARQRSGLRASLGWWRARRRLRCRCWRLARGVWALEAPGRPPRMTPRGTAPLAADGGGAVADAQRFPARALYKLDGPASRGLRRLWPDGLGHLLPGRRAPGRHRLLGPARLPAVRSSLVCTATPWGDRHTSSSTWVPAVTRRVRAFVLCCFSLCLAMRLAHDDETSTGRRLVAAILFHTRSVRRDTPAHACSQPEVSAPALRTGRWRTVQRMP